jgi:hypothetical protein
MNPMHGSTFPTEVQSQRMAGGAEANPGILINVEARSDLMTPESGSSSNSPAEVPRLKVEALFTFSFTIFLALSVVVILICAPLAALYLSLASTGPAYVLTALIFLLATVLQVVIIVVMRLQRVRSFRFYDDHFKLTGRGTKIESGYSTISRVELGQSRFTGKGIRITMASQDKPIPLPANPRNQKLKTNLYSWLTEKVQQQQLTPS